MGWAIGWDGYRDVGYGVPAWCDHPDCTEEIDRGLAHACGAEPYGGDRGCGLYFCGAHLLMADDESRVCERCVDLDNDGNVVNQSFRRKPDHPDWVAWKLADDSWSEWREKHPEQVAAMRESLPTVTADRSIATPVDHAQPQHNWPDNPGVDR